MEEATFVQRRIDKSKGGMGCYKSKEKISVQNVHYHIKKSIRREEMKEVTNATIIYYKAMTFLRTRP